MTELVQRSTDFVRSALLEHLRFESNVEAGALTQQPRGQQWRVIRVSGDMLCGFLEFGEGNDRRRSNLGKHGGSLRSRVRRSFASIKEVMEEDQPQRFAFFHSQNSSIVSKPMICSRRGRFGRALRAKAASSSAIRRRSAGVRARSRSSRSRRAALNGSEADGMAVICHGPPGAEALTYRAFHTV